MDAWGFTETLSCFLGWFFLVEGSSGHLAPFPPSFPPAFPSARASACSITTTSFWGLLEVVGSVLTSQG